MSQDEPRGRDPAPQPTETVEGGEVDWGLRLEPGSVLGNRYRILSTIGAGGMGEVWHAFDLKLRVEVALKALRPELFRAESRRELLRTEVRTAREVMSPNVCRIFDLVEVDGGELVSMEYVDGQTLLQVLQERGPLELREAQDVASQFLAGLEAIHRAGLVHRDVKPENIMLTRAGRVVVMDFGLARQEAEGSGSASGTPAYMAPEQAAGLKVDARADVYSAGVVLAEMVHPEGIKNLESRKSVWEGIRHEPARVPESPWKPVLKRAVAKEPDRRFNSAHTLTRALEDVTLRVEGAEDLTPYPGLAAFTEADAEYFFGREAEVERLWRRLDRPHLLAIVGPSGSGKTSFIGAGLVPSAAADWAIVRCTPGGAALASLRRALAPEISDDPVAVSELAAGDADATVSAFSRWRARHGEVLLVVDQFEELFTLNPAGEQEQFAELLERLALDADVFVLLSMRDDFLMQCRDHEPLKPIFSDLTALPTLAGSALRRALVHPATKCGYRFEDDELVEEMLAEVEGERGALPLLAFAVSRLWEKRDRETGLLTRQAYRDIGGVGGALARHAEATIDRIGADRIPIVRELFRNLVTAEGTRAVREWDELLSVFDSDTRTLSSRAKRPRAAESRDPLKHGATMREATASADAGDPSTRSLRSLAQDDKVTTDRHAAFEVLAELIDARLLTSYEVSEEGREPTRHVEIVHESLLDRWPRLVGWRTQDADSVRVRDELRQAARTWQEHDRSDDLLWTGSAYREFSVWRERYEGGLSEIEEAFARAMTAHAKRRRRRRRLAVAAAFAVLLVVLTVVVVSRQQAVAEANRAEASKLVALGRFVLEADRTEALAYAIASLERSDTVEARRLALRALWAGPPVLALPVEERVWGLAVSPDNRHIAAGLAGGVVLLLPRDGGAPITLQASGKDREFLSFSPDGRLLIGGSMMAVGEVQVWDIEARQLVRTLQSPEPLETLVAAEGVPISWGLIEPDLTTVLTVNFQYASADDQYPEFGHWLLRRWPLDGSPSQQVGKVPGTWAPFLALHLSRGLLATGIDEEIHLHRLENLGREPTRIVGRHARYVQCLTFDSTGGRLAASDTGGTVRVWPLGWSELRAEHEFTAPGFPGGVAFSPDGSRLAVASRESAGWLWDLRGPASAAPLRFGAEATNMTGVAFTPDGRWLATIAVGAHPYRLALWPLGDHFPRVLPNASAGTLLVFSYYPFHPDGSRIFTVVHEEDGGSALMSWPLTGGAGREPTVLFRDANFFNLIADPLGRFLITDSIRGIRKIPLDGTAPTVVDGLALAPWGFDFDPTGRYLASHTDRIKGGPIVEVLDLETGERVKLDEPGDGRATRPFFDPSGRLVVARGGVVSRWDRESGTTEVLVSEGVRSVYPLRDDRRLCIRLADTGARAILDLEDGSRTPLPEAHQPPSNFDFDPTGSIVVSGHPDGEIRVGPLFSEQPHVLLGHEPGETDVWVSPDGQRIASLSSGDDTVRLWPMPDVSKPPLHTLPHDELMAKLKALTNLRAVPDEESHTGYTIEADFSAYRGWGTVPEW
jgi:WD40 repeat protein